MNQKLSKGLNCKKKKKLELSINYIILNENGSRETAQLVSTLLINNNQMFLEQRI